MSVTFSIDTEGFDLNVNMSNVNAARVLGELGLYDPEGDLGGELPAVDFLGRVLLALAVTPEDEGVPSTTSRGAQGAIWIDCGRPAGYLQMRLGELHALAIAGGTGEVYWY